MRILYCPLGRENEKLPDESVVLVPATGQLTSPIPLSPACTVTPATGAPDRALTTVPEMTRPGGICMSTRLLPVTGTTAAVEKLLLPFGGAYSTELYGVPSAGWKWK